MDLTDQPAMRSYYSGIQCSEKAAEGNNCGEKSSCIAMKYIFLNYKGRFATTIFSATQGSNVGTISQPFETM